MRKIGFIVAVVFAMTSIGCRLPRTEAPRMKKNVYMYYEAPAEYGVAGIRMTLYDDGE